MEKWQGKLLLKNIALRNFRQFEQLNINFDERLTVFIGTNGCGKTTVVDAITRCMRVFAERIQRVNSDIDISRFFPLEDIKHGVVTVSELTAVMEFVVNEELYKEQKNKDNEAQIRQLQEKKQEEIDYYRHESERMKEQARANYVNNLIALRDAEKSISEGLNQKLEEIETRYKDEGIDFSHNELTWTIGRERHVTKGGYMSDITDIEKIGRDLDWIRYEQKPPANISIPVMVTYPCTLLQSPPTHSTSATFDLFSTYHGSFEGNPVSLEELTHWYRAEEGLAREFGDTRLLQSVQNAIYIFLSDDNNKFDQLRISFVEDKNGELLLNKNGTPLRVRQLSSGEKMLFLLVADLARRMAIANPGSPDPCNEGTGIVLIDEIDLHLHPKREVTVLDKLKSTFKKCQFIITTHSPIIVSQVEKHEQIWVLSNGQAKYPKKIEGRDFASILLEDMGVYIRPKKYAEDIKQFNIALDNYRSNRSIEDVLTHSLKTLWKELKKDWGEEDEEIKALKILYQNCMDD